MLKGFVTICQQGLPERFGLYSPYVILSKTYGHIMAHTVTISLLNNELYGPYVYTHYLPTPVKLYGHTCYML
ncbi:exo-beta--glucanase [Moniliophthora roreri]|nr:exo-beta--glucanase [Moniliophthora roreri]